MKPEGPQMKYTPHARCMLDKQSYTHTHAHAYAPGHSHTRARAHTENYVLLIAFPRQQWFLQWYVIRTLTVLLHPVVYLVCSDVSGESNKSICWFR